MFQYDALQLCALLSSFALFSVAVARMFEARRPCIHSASCVGRWAVEGWLHVLLAVSVVAWWLETRDYMPPGEWHLCLVRIAVAGLLSLPWLHRRPKTLRTRATDAR